MKFIASKIKFKELNVYVKYGLGFLICLLIYLIIDYPRPLFNKPLSTIVFSQENELLGVRIAKDGQWRFPMADSLPNKYAEALVCYEDKRFYYHLGVDPIAIIGSLKNNIIGKGRKRGGSTIAMQIMRMAQGNSNRNIFNKGLEAFHAIYLSIRYKKTTQLKIYASNAPFGGNVVGIEAASWKYFGKSPHLISWAEAALLVVLPNAPSMLRLDKNRQRLVQKRNQLLQQLNQLKKIDDIEYQLAVSEPLPPTPLPLPNEYPHLVERLRKEYPSQHRFQTTIHTEIQQACKEIAEFHHEINSQNKIQNIAIIVVENKTGHVLSYIGNTTKKVSGHQVDMVHAKRSSGSVLKPILATAVLDEGKVTTKTLMKDIPTYINGYSPENFDKNFRGLVSIEEALQLSLNVPFVLMLKDYNISRFVDQCKKVGITTFTKSPDHYGLTAILGGGEVKLWEVVGAYSSMARTLINYTHNNSKYSASDWFSPKLLYSKNNNHDYQFEKQVFSAGSIYQCFEALKNLARPNEEGLWEEFSSSKQIAWKTGTSFGHKDAWAVGLNKNYTVGIWVGNANGASVASITGVKVAAPVMFDVFNRLEGNQWFDIPYDDLVKVPLCRESGYLAKEHCTTIDTLFIQNSGKNMGTCPYHQTINLDENSSHRVFADCYPIDKQKKKSFFIIPSELSIYYKINHSQYQEVPETHPDCKTLNMNGESSISITYPFHNSKIHLTKDITGKEQKLIFKATHQNQDGLLYWHLDDIFLGNTVEFHTMTYLPKKGPHKLVIMDEKGSKKEVVFKIE